MIIQTIVLFVLCFAAGGVKGRRGFGGTEQEWGYVEVRPNAHMFWWLYYTTANVTDYNEKPLVIWIQGGPGSSGTGYGNFEELGLLDINGNRRERSWVRDYNVLFIDNPVGSGFSYVTDDAAYVTTNGQIAADLLTCIKDFLAKFPAFASLSTYIVAESYGGKMAVEFARVWHEAEQNSTIQSNLKGIGLIDSSISPIDFVTTWAPYLLATGLIDMHGYQQIDALAKLVRIAVEDGRWTDAKDQWVKVDLKVGELTSDVDFYNILKKVSSHGAESPIDPRLEPLMNGPVKELLGIEANWGNQMPDVMLKLWADNMKPTTHHVEYLLNNTNIKVFVITGQLDLIIDSLGTVRWVDRLKWPHAQQWSDAIRYPLIVDSIVEGYFKHYGNFRLYWVSRSGHMVPTDNPAAMAAILEELTTDDETSIKLS